MSRYIENHKRPIGFGPKFVSIVSLLLSLILLGLACTMVYGRYRVKHGGVPASNKVATVTSTKPSEQSVPSNYSVPADQPLSIDLPTIHTTGYIQKVGADKNNQMVAPGNINMAGWYVGSAKPGHSGLSIIEGHVHGLYSKGIFYNLSQLRMGDKFSVTYGDHRVQHFQVKHVNTVSIDDAPKALFALDQTIGRQLNLITCGDTYVASSNKSYSGRVIVVSEWTPTQ